MLTVWLLACAASPLSVATVHACTPYASDEDLLTACVIRSVLPIGDPALAIFVCDSLPLPRSAECRGRWVNAQSGFPSLSREVLLYACDGQPDCAFDALDARPIGTYADQVLACEQHAGRYVDDCDGAPPTMRSARRCRSPTPTGSAC